MSSFEDDGDDEFGYPSDVDSFEGSDGDCDIFHQEDWPSSSQTDSLDIFTTEKPKTKQYVSMSPDDIIDKQQDSMNAINSVLPHLPISSVRVLLQKYNWDSMRLLSAFTENPDKICDEVGIPLPSEEVGTRDGGIENCQICYDEDELLALPCGHAFCGECWNRYLAIAIKERNQRITCCGENCNMVIDEFTVMNLLKDAESKNIFKEVLMNSFVQDNPMCKWCPAPGCKNAIFLLDIFGEGNEVVRCSCSHAFCFRCLVGDHRPCSCFILQEWKKIHQGESTSLDEGYVAAYSRPCPKCHCPIEKNQGCNHMTCKCGYHFCWSCMGQFGSGTKGGSDGYSTHKCNGLYEEDDNTKNKKAELERYKHYSERYETHQLSAKLEQKMLIHEEKILGVMKSEGFLGNDFSPAVHQILENRNALKFSYAFGYFRATLAKYVNKGIFENLQLDLERHTELLSRLTSEFSDNILSDAPTEIDERRQAVVNQTRIAAKVLEALLDASSAWSLKAVDNREPTIEPIDLVSMDTSEEESEDAALAPPKRKKHKKSNKKKEITKSDSRRTKAASSSSVYKKSLEKMQEGEIKGQEKKKKTSRLLRFRKKNP